ncbi:MAG TPA: hypothetical protein VHC69_09695 [Polyangiaceae bacterium]|nr:hypothetical protein [Polyangiaceae bacterium]
MKIGRNLFPVVVLAAVALGQTGCGGSAPEPETPASEGAGAAESRPAEEAKPADGEPTPAPQEKHGLEGGTEGAVPSSTGVKK